MPIRTDCPQCRFTYNVPDAQLGQRVRCKHCQEVFTVASSGAPAVEPEPPLAMEAEPVAQPVAQPPAAIPVRRPRRPMRRVEEPVRERSSGAGVLVAVLVMVGTLVVLGGGSFAAYWFLIRSPYESQPDVEFAKNNPFTNVNPQGGGAPREDLGPAGTERLSYEPKDLDMPEAGVRRLTPETPVPAVATAELPGKPGGGEGQLALDVLNRVKTATAFLRVRMADDNQGEGTGFFAMEKGVLVTNAHVVGMVMPNSGKPKHIEVILNSGLSDERTFTSPQVQVIGVDRRADLAVLSVRGENLPEPLRVDSSRDLHETQPVFVSGFPLGSMRSRNISITPTAVDSLHREDGLVERVQVRGAMLPGNSGGPVVDPRGNVIGVSVAMQGGQDIMGGVVNTGINFAVPSDKVHHLLHGRLTELSIGYPTQSGAEVKLAISGELFDHRGYVKQASLEWWIGNDGAERLGALKEPAAMPGDEPRNRLSLKVASQKLSGELVLPKLPEGKVIWLQTMLAGKDGTNPRWTAAIAYRPPPILQEKAIRLLKKSDAALRSVDVALRGQFVLQMQGRQGLPGSLHLHGRMEEKSGGEQHQLSAFDLGIRMGGQTPTRADGRRMLGRRLAGQPPTSELTALPAKSRVEATVFSPTLEAWVKALEVPLPGDIKPRQVWTETRSAPLDHTFDSLTLQAYDIKYTYLGVRTRDGKEEALVTFDGKPSGNESVSGQLRGSAWVELSTGKASLVRAMVEYVLPDQTLPFQMGGVNGPITGKVDVRLHRP
jgi:predicted Zn finger-like uncharacterized protein